MNAILEYLKGFLVLFLLLTILVNMVPKESYRKYIRFFSQMILAFGIFYPLFGYLCDEDELLEQIQYETFVEGLTETARDNERISYLQNEFYVEEYEKAIAMDAGTLAEECGYTVEEAAVDLSDDFEIEQIRLVLLQTGKEEIVIGEIQMEPETEKTDQTEDEKYQLLKEKLIHYYQLTEEQLFIICE